tara:strand:+ start:592 stop:1551 length:960 start_codon:yes stop_codon:yes gene_type:complete
MKSSLLKDIYFELFRIREIEKSISLKYNEKKMRCPVHLSVGQETVSAVFSKIVKKKDFVVSTHRSHAHYLGKGGSLKKMISEIYGKETGCSKGKGGSMHLVDLKVNFMGSSPIVGNITPLGVGLGLSAKLKKTDQVCFVFLGDGALEQGSFYESLNFSSVKKIPVVFVCENNLYSVYTKISERQPINRNNCEMVRSIGVKSKFCDGNDINKVYKTFKETVDQVRKKKIPYFLEFSTYRWLEHCGPNYDNNIGYRSEKEFLNWKKKDQLKKIRSYLIKKNFEKQILSMEKKINLEIQNAFRYAENSKFPNEKSSLEGEYA